jgi:hypothetical protein
MGNLTAPPAIELAVPRLIFGVYRSGDSPVTRYLDYLDKVAAETPTLKTEILA